jgi:microcin C transport system permease protein
MRLSPLWQRRSALFWAHRRGRVALFIFLGVAVLSLGGNFIANDKPLVVEYRGALYFPVVQRVPEQVFGAAFLPTEADYTNPDVKAAISAHGWMIWPLVPYAADSIVWNAGAAPAHPDARNWLGTDDVSRDVLARVIYGLRLSLGFGFALTFAAALLGILAGAVQGFYGGLTDLLFQRATEIWSGIPQLFLLLLLSSLVLPGFFLLLLFMLAFSWMALAGLVRAEFLRLRNLDYVRAATALGVPEWRIMTRHMLPNALTTTISFLPFILADSIALLASLDFLGLGMPPGTASLGQLIAQARDNPQAPWLGVTIFVILGGLLLLLIFIGEAVRQSFDPHRAP